MKATILAVLLGTLTTGAYAQSIYTPSSPYNGTRNSFTVYTVPPPPPPPTMNDWQRFTPQYQQMSPPPAPRTCHFVNSMMYCQ